MPRHQGTVVSVGAGTVRGRRGDVWPADQLQVGEGVLYYRSPWPGPHPRFRGYESWVIAEEGWVVSRFHLHPDVEPNQYEWYVDIDEVQVNGDSWRLVDRFLDVAIREGSGYEVWDADELADGIAQGEIEVAEAVAALRSLDGLCRALVRLGYSGRALLEEYAPGLPR